MEKIKLNKFDAAERQLLLAIRLFFAEEDSVSIHTLAEAAGQVLYDIGKSKNVHSIVRDMTYIKPGMQKEWLQGIFAARNFFKHADKDKESQLEFNPDVNDFSLWDACQMHQQIKKASNVEVFIFTTWFYLRYDNLIEDDSPIKLLQQKAKQTGTLPNHNNKKMFAEVLSSLKANPNALPGFQLI